MLGRVIADKYELRRKIGQGGMGQVWEAHDRALERDVAIKLLADRTTAAFKARFQREARALAQVQSDHIVQVYDFGLDEDAPYMVMELLVGEDLETRMRREGAMTPAAVLQLIRQTASGLTAAAQLDIIHRDLKPANVFIARNSGRDLVKILDFGVAWTADASDLTAKGALLGTPHYMSPEQIRGRTPTRQGDLWSLAVIAFRALTGALPFPANHLGDLIVSICTDAHPVPSTLVPGLPKELDHFFDQALAKDPRARFATASTLLEAFTKACNPATTINILAVDDEPDMAHLLEMRFRKQIRSAAYRFLFAENGEIALDVLRQHPEIDVILSDINMPVMDGLTLLEHIPSLTPHARTVMVSAYGDMDNIRRAMNVGAFDFVTKPIDFKDLDTTVKKAANAVTQLRAMASSDRENEVLRQLTSTVLTRRLESLELRDALHSEPIEASVVVVNVGRPERMLEPTALARMLNANYEVIVPILQKLGGMVDSIVGDELVCAWIGDKHLARALDACRSICREVANLAIVVGSDSPFSRGLAVGVASGPLLTTSLGSNVGGRFTYTMVGPVIDEALALAHRAKLGEIQVSPTAVEQASAFTFELVEDGSSPQPGYALPWSAKVDEQFYVAPTMTHTAGATFSQEDPT